MFLKIKLTVVNKKEFCLISIYLPVLIQYSIKSRLAAWYKIDTQCKLTIVSSPTEHNCTVEHGYAITNAIFHLSEQSLGGPPIPESLPNYHLRNIGFSRLLRLYTPSNKACI